MTNRTEDARLAELVRKGHEVRREIEKLHQPAMLRWVEEGWREKKHEIMYALPNNERRALADRHDGTPIGRGESRVRILTALLHALKVRQGDPKAVALAKIGDEQSARVAAMTLEDEELGGEDDV